MRREGCEVVFCLLIGICVFILGYDLGVGGCGYRGCGCGCGCGWNVLLFLSMRCVFVSFWGWKCVYCGLKL